MQVLRNFEGKLQRKQYGVFIGTSLVLVVNLIEPLSQKIKTQNGWHIFFYYNQRTQAPSASKPRSRRTLLTNLPWEYMSNTQQPFPAADTSFLTNCGGLTFIQKFLLINQHSVANTQKLNPPTRLIIYISTHPLLLCGKPFHAWTHVFHLQSQQSLFRMDGKEKVRRFNEKRTVQSIKCVCTCILKFLLSLKIQKSTLGRYGFKMNYPQTQDGNLETPLFQQSSFKGVCCQSC